MRGQQESEGSGIVPMGCLKYVLILATKNLIIKLKRVLERRQDRREGKSEGGRERGREKKREMLH